ncbi:MAG: NAD-dependent epimerase/dehydratase family protein [Betaproteobacteria bacterium]|nr:NAD-dependent epimerase/dehydratase family protein [Betaproteobacteria bacterium]
MKNILIIGGSYFAGRVLVEELAKDSDFAVHVFNRGRRTLSIAGVTELIGDREQAKQICHAIPDKEWDAVIDFCAYTPAHIKGILDNLPGKIGQYIFISTTSVYQKSWGLPIAEDAPLLAGPQPELGSYADYGYDKVRAESTLRQMCDSSATPYTILRPTIIYGYYNYAPRETYFFDLLRNHKPIVIPQHDLALFSFIWVVDMAQMIMRCINDPRTYKATFNLAADEFVSYSRIVEVLGEITGKRIEPVRMTVPEIERQGIPLPFPLDHHLIYTGAKIRQLFDFTYTPFRKGLREALKYYLMVQKQRGASAA